MRLDEMFQKKKTRTHDCFVCFFDVVSGSIDEQCCLERRER